MTALLCGKAGQLNASPRFSRQHRQIATNRDTLPRTHPESHLKTPLERSQTRLWDSRLSETGRSVVAGHVASGVQVVAGNPSTKEKSHGE